MHFRNFKNKLLIFLILFSTIFSPLCVYAYSNKLYVGGENIGISVKSDGILVVGFYNVNDASPGKEAGLRVGDRIVMIDDSAINGVDELSKVVSDSKAELIIIYKRDDKKYKTILKMIKDDNNVYKTGLYVKDSIIGIGTLTFIDPATKKFGALGHEIIEKATGQKFEIKDGNIFKSNVTSILKSTRNNPGEKNATFYSKIVYGTIDKNTLTGIYGIYNGQLKNRELLPVASNKEINIGEATIRTVLSGSKIEQFTINIIKVNQANDTKNILFEITDNSLLEKTNGIVQGMSGSPIIQNNKIIGAVTHVVVDNPIKGYGIFISSMLEEMEKE